MTSKSPVLNCLEFFQKAVPNTGSKNIHTQLGVHLEEVGEMLEEISAVDEHTVAKLFVAREALRLLANHLKSNDSIIRIRDDNRFGYLDAICDQMVTAIGCAHMMGFDIAGAFDEVNRSNLSKFDEAGQPIFDENRKIMKGPNYSPANLEPFV